jgi:hypothetical protein
MTELAKVKVMQARTDALKQFLGNLDGQPSPRVNHLLGWAVSVPVDTIRQLVALDVWPAIHRLIDNDAYTFIKACVLNANGAGVLVLSQRVDETVQRTIAFNADAIISDESRLVNAPGRLIDGPRAPDDGIDDLDDKGRGVKPL